MGADHHWGIVEDEIIRGNGSTAVWSAEDLLSSLCASFGHAYQTYLRPVKYILNVITSCIPEENALERLWSLESMGIVSDIPDEKTTEYLQQHQQKSIELQRWQILRKTTSTMEIS